MFRPTSLEILAHIPRHFLMEYDQSIAHWPQLSFSRLRKVIGKTHAEKNSYRHYHCENEICLFDLMLYVHGKQLMLFWDRAGRDDVTTGKLFPSLGECLGLYRCVLIIFKRK